MTPRTLCLMLALAGLIPATAGAVGTRTAQPRRLQAVSAEGAGGTKLVIDVWTDRGDGSVYNIGDPIRVHFRVSRDCYVLVYDVDTEGRVHMLFPYRRLDPHWVTGGREYVLPGPHSSYALTIEGPPGVEYIQALASLEPFQQLPEWMDPDAVAAEYDLDRTDWRNSGSVVGDPFLGMDRINRSILPYDCDEEDCYSAAYTTYYVERKVAYPRYLCTDCHGPYAGVYYDPYGARCSVFEVRVDYDWRWRRHWPYYGNPYWYYYRRSDCPPRYFGFKPRWSSSDGWIHFRDSFGERVLWKKNPGRDPKDGNDPRWREHNGGGPPPPSGSFGGASPPGPGSSGIDGRRRVRTQPVRVPAQPLAPAEEPVRFRSRSRDVTPPSQPRVEVRRDSPPSETPRRTEGRDRARDPKRDEPSREAPREQPRREQPPARQEPVREEPRREAPPREQPRREEPAREQPRREEPAREQPKREEPAREQPKRQEFMQNQPRREEARREEPVRPAPAREPFRGK